MKIEERGMEEREKRKYASGGTGRHNNCIEKLVFIYFLNIIINFVKYIIIMLVKNDFHML